MNKNTTVLIVGGTGFVGSAIIRQALKLPNIKIISVQRHLPAKPTDSRVVYVQGSCLLPETFKEQIKEADVVIHSLGVLIDSHITKRIPKGGEGTYEQVNFETAKRLGDLTNSFTDKKRKFFFLSAKYGLPFTNRYLDTKRMAEAHLSTLNNIQFTAFYAGLVVDWKERLFTGPLGIVMDVVSRIEHCWLIKPVFSTPLIGSFLSRFIVDTSTQREDLAKGIAYCAVDNSSSLPLKLENPQIREASINFDGLI